MAKKVIVISFVFLLIMPVSVLGVGSWSLEPPTNITSMSVSEDGTRVAVGTYDARALVYDTEGNLIYSVEAQNVVTGVTLLEDGRLLVSSDDRHVYMYDPLGNLLWDQYLERLVKNVQSTADGSLIIVYVGGKNDIKYLNEDGEIIEEVELGIAPQAIHISQDGEWIAVATADQYINMLNREGEIQNRIPSRGSIASVVVTDDGDLVVGTERDEVIMYDSEGNEIGSFQTRGSVHGVDVSRDGQFMAVADYSGYYYVLDRSGNRLWSSTGQGAGRQVKFSPDSRMIFTGSGEGIVQSFNVSNAIAEAQKAMFIRKVVTTSIIVLSVAILGTLLYLLKKHNKLGVFRRIWISRFCYLALLPSFSLLFVFLYYPALSGLFYSLYDWNPAGRSTFLGLENFRRMVDDPYVTVGIKNLLLLIATGIFKTIVPPLLVAELIFYLRNKGAQYWYRTLFVTSMIIPAVAGALIWQNLYDPNVGLINKTLELIGLGAWSHPWLGDTATAIWAIIFIGFPFVGILSLLVFYAGLISIPGELTEAAKMDGASTARIIRSVHLPLLAGQFKLLIVLGMIGIIQDFGSILIITGGGPQNATYVPALQMYYAATVFGDLGYASAIGVAMFAVIMIITIINMKFIKTAD